MVRRFKNESLDDAAKRHWPFKLTLAGFVAALTKDKHNFENNMKRLGMVEEKWPEEWMELFLKWAEFNTTEPQLACSGTIKDPPPPPPAPRCMIMNSAEKLIGYLNPDGTIEYVDTAAAKLHKWSKGILEKFGRGKQKPYKSYTDEP